MQQQIQLTWKERRKRKRKQNFFRGTAFIITLAASATIVLIAIGAYSPTIGAAIIGGAALFLAFLAWLFPRTSSSDTGSQGASSLQSVSLQATGNIASTSSFPVASALSSNPFKALGKLLDPDDFYGRQSERNTLIERTKSKSSTSIVGPRRIGKTWLLQYIMLVSPTKLSPTYYIVEMSLQSAEFSTLMGFVNYILLELKRQMHRGTTTYKILEEALNELHKEPNTLVVLERALRGLSREGIVSVLCIDEFNNISLHKKQFNLDFFRSLRTMADGQNTNLVLIIASQDTLKKIVGRVGRESGFFNIFNQITIKPFNLAETEDFIQTKGDQAQFTDLERDYLLKLGGRGWWLWRKYWPIRLEQAGEVIWRYRTINPDYHQLDGRKYWRILKRQVAEKAKSVF